jgi:hypothetical protein
VHRKVLVQHLFGVPGEEEFLGEGGEGVETRVGVAPQVTITSRMTRVRETAVLAGTKKIINYV